MIATLASMSWVAAAGAATNDPEISELLSPQAYTPESQALATADGMSAILHNPAAVGVRGRGMFWGGSMTESEWSNLSILGQLGSLGYGYQHWSDDFYGINQDQYLLGLGFPVGRHARFGFSHSWWRAGFGSVRKAGSWSTSLLIRPTAWLSLGAMVSDLNRPRFGEGVIPRMYRAGVGIRPNTDRLTLTFDAASDMVDRWEDADYRWGVQLEPVDGLLLSGSIDQDQTVRVGLGLNFRKGGIGAIASQTDEGPYRSQSYYAEFTNLINRSNLSREKRVAKFLLAGSYRDEPSEGTFGGGDHRGGSHLLSAIRKAVDDETVSGIYLDIWGFSNAAIAQEIHDEMLLAKSRGKKIVAYIGGGGGPTEYLVAATADTIVIPETIGFDSFGFMARVQMMKGLMDKLGIEFERYPCRECDYKSAYFQLTEDEVPEEFRQEVDSIFDDWLDQFLSQTAEARGMERTKLEEVFDGRPIMAAEAKEIGLVDVLAYSDIADSLANVMTRSRIVDGWGIAKERHREYAWCKPPTVAIIAAMGSIDVGENRSGFFDGNVIGSATLMRTIQHVQNDPDVKAVVLRIDSPGGSGYASDMIWYQIEDLKDRTKKPFVSSMGLVAGSGGYYIAMNSDKILADPATITGSIGVTGMKPITAGLYSKIGIRNEIFKRGEHTDMFTTNRRTTDEERDMILDIVDDFYEVFTSKVAEGRGMTQQEVKRLAAGRIYTGRQALDNGLIDRLGGTREAITLAAEMAGVEDNYRIAYYHRPRKSLWQRLTGMGRVEVPDFRTVFETPGPMTYTELGAALAESN
jgi:protease-4